MLSASGLYSRIISRKLKTSTELTRRLPWPYLGYPTYSLPAPPCFIRNPLHVESPYVGSSRDFRAFPFRNVLNFLFYDPKK